MDERKATHDPSPMQYREQLAYDETFNCVQCGYCLPVCPTYETMGRESQSPRGRIQLVKSAAEGKLTDLDALAAGIDNCLGCRACETACPTGVQYGRIFESAKTLLAAQKKSTSLTTRLMRRLIPSRLAQRGAAFGLWAAQSIGLLRLMRKLNLHRLLPEPIAAFIPALPRLASPWRRWKRPRRFLPDARRHKEQAPRTHVAFFTGCVMDMLYESANWNSMRLLAQAGCSIVVFTGAGCCGALHAHSGDAAAARRLAEHNMIRLERLERRQRRRFDHIVHAAGGCGAMLQEYEHLFQNDDSMRAKARDFSARSKDWTALLTSLSAAAVDAEQGSDTTREIVTYQPSCHMTHVQHNTEPPVSLIRSVEGVKFRPMNGADLCCGSAGTYNIERYAQSMDILDRKMSAVRETEASTVITTNPGCLLQMQLGIQREGLQGRVRAVHLADWLVENDDDLIRGGTS